MPKFPIRISLGYHTDPITNKRKQIRKVEMISAKTLAEAKEKAKKVAKNKKSPSLKTNGAIKFKHIIDEFYLVNKKLKPKTKVSDIPYRKGITLALGDYDAIEITAEVIFEYVNALEKAGAGESHLANFKKALNKYFRFATEFEYIERNPMLKIKRFIGTSIIPKEPKVHMLDSFKKIYYKLCHSSPQRKSLLDPTVQFMLAADACLRNAELYGLTWNDINLIEGYLVVNHTAYHFSKREAEEAGVPISGLETTKTLGSKRQVPLSALTIEKLKIMKNENDAFLHKHNMKNPLNLLFFKKANVAKGSNASICYGSGFANFLKRICDKLNIERITPHDVRRSGYSLRLENEINEYCCKYILGHSPGKANHVYTAKMYNLAKNNHQKWEKILLEIRADAKEELKE